MPRSLNRPGVVMPAPRLLTTPLQNIDTDPPYGMHTHTHTYVQSWIGLRSQVINKDMIENFLK